MNTIYIPHGKAREYSPYSLNIYTGCDHDCSYCYVKKYDGKWKKDWPNVAKPRKDILANVVKKLDSLNAEGRRLKQVLLSFQGDPYCKAEMEYKVTQEILYRFHAYKVPVAILTKGGKRALRDIEMFKMFGKNIKVGQTITFVDSEKSLKWEPGAAGPIDRLRTFQTLRAEGIRTWVSFEPVIEPGESLAAMEVFKHCIDEVKIGKLNYHPEEERKVDWAKFLYDAIRIFDTTKVDVYIKKSLQMVAKGKVNLGPRERDAEVHHLPEWRD